MGAGETAARLAVDSFTTLRIVPWVASPIASIIDEPAALSTPTKSLILQDASCSAAAAAIWPKK